MEPHQLIQRMPNFLRWIIMPIITFISFFAADITLKILLKINTLWLPDTVFFFIPTEYFFLIQEHIISAFLVGVTPLIVGAMIAPSHKLIVAISFGLILFIIGMLSSFSFYLSENWIKLINVVSTMFGAGWAIRYIMNKLKIYNEDQH